MKTLQYRLKLHHFDNWEGGGCSVTANGTLKRSLTAGGCGYDRQGAALSNFLMTLPKYQEGIKHLSTRNYYGLTHWNKITKKSQNRANKNTQSYTDGACGENCIVKIANACGIEIESFSGGRSSTFYTISY